MKPTREEEATTKLAQVANALVEYLVKHDVHSAATAMSLAGWAEATAKMQNENLLVNMYESIGKRLVDEVITCRNSSYLVTVMRGNEKRVYFDFPQSQKEMDARLDKERSA